MPAAAVSSQALRVRRRTELCKPFAPCKNHTSLGRVNARDAFEECLERVDAIRANARSGIYAMIRVAVTHRVRCSSLAGMRLPHPD
jgi:hypothetical protein